MKILIISHGFPIKGYPSLIGGISFSLEAFFDTFNKYNHKISVFMLPFDLYKKLPVQKGINNIYDYRKFGKKNFLVILKDLFNFFRIILELESSLKDKIKLLIFNLSIIRLLFKAMNLYEVICYYDEKYKFDIVLAYESQLPAQIGFLLKKKKNKRFYAISHGNEVIGKNNNPLTKTVLKNADKIILRSEFLKELVSKQFLINKKNFSLCTEGIIEEKFKLNKSKSDIRQELKMSKDDFYILTVGTLYNIRKGFDLVLKSIKELRDKYSLDISNIKYLIVGRDEPNVRKWLYHLASKFNLERNFEILTDVNNNLRNMYLKASDIYVMPSRDLKNKGSIEGFGNVFIEAGYYGVPSIGSLTGGISAAIEDGKSGLLVKSFDDLVDKIKLLFENEELRKRLGNYAHERVMKKFTWKSIYNDYLNAFK